MPSRGVPLAVELGIWNLSQIPIRSGELADAIRTNPDKHLPPPDMSLISNHFHPDTYNCPENIYPNYLETLAQFHVS